MSDPTAPENLRHTRFEDAQGLGAGAVAVTMGVALLQHLGLIVGQVAGLSLLISLWTGIGFGLVFFTLNLPFYWLAWRGMGAAFTVKTFIGVALISVLSEAQPHLVTFDAVNPIAGALAAGVFSGMGILAMFRHRASLGGFGVLAYHLQERHGFRAGWTQMVVDGFVFALALTTLPPDRVGLSVLAAAAMNLIIAVNHRRDRYIGF